MRVLLVEDDQEYGQGLRDALLGEVPGLEVRFVRSRDSAFAALQEQTFDLVICDLRIPTSDGALDESVDHGVAVHAGVHGTPVLILSAFGTLELVREMHQGAPREDLYGTGAPILMTDFIQKGNLLECVGRVKACAAEIGRLSEIEVSSGAVAVELMPEERHVLRIFARRLGGRVVRIGRLDGGQSAAKVLRAQVDDAHGARRAVCVAKLGVLASIRDERDRYRHGVVPLLAPGAYTPELDVVVAGAGNVGGLFYRLADGYERSLFDVLRANAGLAVGVVERVRVVEQDWQVGAPVAGVEVSTIRRILVSDAAMDDIRPELVGLDTAAFEGRVAQVKRCHRHCDLHGLNLLVGATQAAVVLIDYATVLDGAPAALDPVTVELSLLFHPGSADVRGTWPSIAQALQWHRLEEYTAGCPVASFVQRCREWAFEVSASGREVYACAYAYAIRQLKYADTNHELARAIARAAIEAGTGG